MGGWRIGLLAAWMACSPAGEAAVQVPSPPPPTRAPSPVVAASEAAGEVPASEAVVRRDCLADVAIHEAPAPTWQLVGTTDEPPHLHAMGSVVFLSTDRRLYDATAGEPLVASTTWAAGLPTRKRVVRMLGSWPDDAWLATFEGENTRGGRGGAKFHLWRWSADRWVRLTRSVVYGDGAPEFYKGRAGRALELRCGEGPELVIHAFGGDGAAPRPLVRAPHSSFCPQVFMATGAGDLFAVDEVRSDPPSVQVSHRCAGCEAAAITALPIPRMCDQGPTWSVWGLRVPQPAGAEIVLGMHTSVVMDDGRGRQSGTFLLRRANEAWSAEAVPGGVAGGTIDGLVAGADGSLWLVTERLLRRGPDGAWTQVPLPDALRGPDVRVDLRGVATLQDEVWLLAETIREGESLWSVFRSGSAAVPGPGAGRPL